MRPRRKGRGGGARPYVPLLAAAMLASCMPSGDSFGNLAFPEEGVLCVANGDEAWRPGAEVVAAS